jgi:deoxyadenosine/deoxycytidine kinase
MWVQIIGGIGAGKNTIAEHLEKNGYLFVKEDIVEGNGFVRDYKIALNKLHEYLYIKRLIEEHKSVVSIRSFWEVFDIFVEVEREYGMYSESEYNILSYIKEKFWNSIHAPHAIFYLKNDKMSAMDRCLLRGRPCKNGY